MNILSQWISQEIVWVSIVGLLLLYVLEIRRSRYRNIQQIQQLGELLTREDKKTFSDIYYSIFQLTVRDFPFSFYTSLDLGGLRSSGVPSISKVLVATYQYTTNTEKRFEDTDLFMREFIENQPGSDRSLGALGRISSFHQHYKIRHDDIVYQLAVYIYEQIRWINLYEWRELLEVEKEALFQFWFKEIGKGLGVSYEARTWTFQELHQWFIQYEELNMVYSKYNAEVTDPFLDLYVTIAPKPFRGVLKRAILQFMGERYYQACYGDLGPSTYEKLLNTCSGYLLFFLLKLRAVMVGNLFFPRQVTPRRTPKAANANDKYIPGWSKGPSCLYKSGYTLNDLGPCLRPRKNK
ncbi:hypothetical protein K7432_007964 [Basidiobolus ranarum]|uniref:ER-bound oxygenase mpaB/mpaB'/Rubber oxygenase catalytic domain-containing protein n=1 Tax=Basidiobolus ranarum TaxID=34480 RepID=A0ABR2WSU3_9FUNG